MHSAILYSIYVYFHNADMWIVGSVEGDGEVQGVVGLARKDVEDAQWTRWTILDRACTRGELQKASGMWYIVSE